MATRSNIVVKQANGKFKRVYCHSAGYLAWNGLRLIESYNSEKLARLLVKPGDISVIHGRCDKPEGHHFDHDKRVEGCTIYYGRDRGDKNCNGQMFDTLEAAIDDHEGYCYIWDDGAWSVNAWFGADENGEGGQMETKRLDVALKEEGVEFEAGSSPADKNIPAPPPPKVKPDYTGQALF